MTITPEMILKGWELSDDEIAAALGSSIDGWWSRQTREIKTHLGAKGIDLNKGWAFTPQSWRCPVCQRSKPEIAKLNESNIVIAHIIQHHDHVREYISDWKKQLRLHGKVEAIDDTAYFRSAVKHIAPRFEETLICEDCNNADADAKRIIGCQDRYFSFTPTEISTFIKKNINAKHTIDCENAIKTFECALASHTHRMEWVNAFLNLMEHRLHWISHPDGVIATKNNPEIHWKCYENEINFRLEESKPGDAYKIIMHSCRRDGSGKGKKTHPSIEDIKIPSNKDYNEYTPQDSLWSKTGDDWFCPVCRRSKFEILRWNPKKSKWSGKIVGGTAIKDQLPTHKRTGDAVITAAVCEDCNNVNARISQKFPQSWRLNAEEIRAITKFSPHARHQIDFDVLEHSPL